LFAAPLALADGTAAGVTLGAGAALVGFGASFPAAVRAVPPAGVALGGLATATAFVLSAVPLATGAAGVSGA